MKTKNLSKYIITILYIGATFFLLIQVGCSSQQSKNGNEVVFGNNGKIVFLWQPKSEYYNVLNLILIDGDGNNARFIGKYSGKPAFSKDGNKLVIGCDPVDKTGLIEEICILDIEGYIKKRSEIPLEGYGYRSIIEQRIPLPEQCLQYQYKQHNTYEGILSLDFSQNSEKILLVCGNLSQQEVCIVNIDGTNNCWNNLENQQITRAEWSPIDENLIVTSNWAYPPQDILLVNQEGKIIRTIGTGWSATWSPKGDRIAFVENLEDAETYADYQGIATVDINGENHQWLYLPNDDDININMRVLETGYPQNISWSPNENYLVVSGSIHTMYGYGIFRIDLNSGKVIQLVDPGIFSNILIEPDWSK